jgi:hypothetical protein
MNDNRQPFGPALTRQKAPRKPNPEKTVAVLLGILLCLTVVSVLGGVETGILAYQGVVVTAIAWLTYRYSKSAESIAKASLALWPAAPREGLLPTPPQAAEDKLLLCEILEELGKAETARRPPFDLSAWQRNEHRLRSRKTLKEAEIENIASCYARLAKENEEMSRWRELESRLNGLVDCVKRRTISLTLSAMEDENLAAIHAATSVLEEYLGQPREVGRNSRDATTRREPLRPTQSRLAVSSFGHFS